MFPDHPQQPVQYSQLERTASSVPEQFYWQKFFMFEFFKNPYIGGRSPIGTDVTVKVWRGLVHPAGRSWPSNDAIWPVPPRPPLNTDGSLALLSHLD